MPEAARSCQELPGTARSCQELPGTARSCQELRGIAKRCEELRGVARNYKELPGPATTGAWARCADDRRRWPAALYEPENLVQTEGGQLEALSSAEVELHAGLPLGFTKHVTSKEAGRRFPDYAEALRCGMAGRAMQVDLTAVLLRLCLSEVSREVKFPGVPSVVRQCRFRRASGVKTHADALEGDACSDAGGASCDIAVSTYAADPCLIDDTNNDVEDITKIPSSWGWSGHLGLHLVEAILRRVDARGSDVRLDLGSLYRPSPWPRMSINPGRWKWRVKVSRPWVHKGAHINSLELRGALLGLQWRTRSSKFHSCRFVHLLDSQVALAVLTKGRSSASVLNKLLIRYAALLIVSNCYSLFGYVATEVNPADRASRRYDSIRDE